MYPETLEGTAYDCGLSVQDETLGNYTKVTNCSCSYCSASCQQPTVDDKIGLIDGLSWEKVGYSYGFFIVFTIIFQIVIHFCCNKKNSGL